MLLNNAKCGEYTRFSQRSVAGLAGLTVGVAFGLDNLVSLAAGFGALAQSRTEARRTIAERPNRGYGQLSPV
jgi:hypothetical protein